VSGGGGGVLGKDKTVLVLKGRSKRKLRFDPELKIRERIDGIS
jgi:hypothetical protein